MLGIRGWALEAMNSSWAFYNANSMQRDAGYVCVMFE